MRVEGKACRRDRYGSTVECTLAARRGVVDIECHAGRDVNDTVGTDGAGPVSGGACVRRDVHDCLSVAGKREG